MIEKLAQHNYKPKYKRLTINIWKASPVKTSMILSCTKFSWALIYARINLLKQKYYRCKTMFIQCISLKYKTFFLNK